MKHAKPLLEELPELLGIDKPALSVDEIADMLGRSRGAVGNLVRQLRAQPEKALYIAEWKRAKGCHAARWKWGNLPDADPLPMLTNAEVCKRYRNTENGRMVHNKGSRRWYRKNDGAAVRLAWRQNREVVRAYSERGVAAIDPLLAAIMGIQS